MRQRSNRLPRAAVVVIACLLCLSVARGQSWRYQYLRSGDPVQDRNAYLLTLLEADPVARTVLANDESLRSIGIRLKLSRAQTYAACAKASTCTVERMPLERSEITAIGNELARLAASGEPLNRLVERDMRPSGRFQLYAGLDDAALMRMAWIETAKGVNRLYDVYGLGQSFPLAEIDGPSIAPGSDDFQFDVASAIDSEVDEGSTGVFFSPWSRLGFDLLVINQRTESGRYEPLEKGANRAAFLRALKVDWAAWRYTAILVPGIGLSAGETHVSPGGAFRVRMAARRWRERLAPFIIVSGGHVHPNRTPYSEAVEMKRMLMSLYDVPEDAIVIDPYARHTTTNLRNGVRLLFRMGAPMHRAFMITSSQDTADYIQSAAFAQRCQDTFGYRPYTIVARLSAYDLSATPNITSLQADLRDPLDP